MAQSPIRTKAIGVTGLTKTEVIAAALAIGWMVMVGLFFWILPPSPTPGESFDSLRFILTLIAIFMPVGMIWVAAAAARSARIMREESFRVQAAIDGMRQTYLSDRAAKTSGQSAGEAKQNEIAQASQKTEYAAGTFASTRDAQRSKIQPAAMRPDNQRTLALGTSSEDTAPPLSRADMIRALNFPDTDQDTQGFAALRRALKDRSARQLVQASQDVLTLLSQDGIYMDDLHPDLSHPDIWRRFTQGERGGAMAGLGGVRDSSSLALASARMREDAIFRDAAHHFLRRFDQTLIAFEPDATDTELMELSDTRTARAFMLLGRVTGTFD